MHFNPMKTSKAKPYELDPTLGVKMLFTILLAVASGLIFYYWLK